MPTEWTDDAVAARAKRIEILLAEQPALFVDVVSKVFRPAKGREAEPTEVEQKQAEHAYRLLDMWHTPPGRTAEGMDAQALNSWISEARQLLEAADRLAAGDTRIGHVLWWSPKGSDGHAPHEAVRDLIGAVGNDEIESGFHVEAVNSEGAHFVDPSGGSVERGYASEYRETADALRAKWPRTAEIFDGLADDWEHWAKRQDDEAALRHSQQEELKRE